jgi:hypothetical protein
LFVLSLPGRAQQSQFFDQVLNDTALSVSVSGSAFHQSAALDNYFVSRFLLGGSIDSARRWQMYDNMQSTNLMGANARLQIQADLFRKKGLVHSASLHYNTDLLLRFHKYSYGLGFMGNAAFLGDTMNAEKNNVLTYAQYGVSYGIRGKRWSISAGLHALSGYLTATVPDLTVYTSSTVDQLDLMVSGNATQMKPTGFGGGVHVNAAWVFSLKQHEDDTLGIDLIAQVEGLGISFIPAGSLNRWETTRSLSWSGFDLQALLNNDTALTAELEAFADSASLTSAARNTWFVHPATVHVGKLARNQYTGVPDAIFGIRMRLTGMYYPYAYLGAHYVFKNRSDVGFVAGFGGFGGLQVGAYTHIQMGNCWRVLLSTDNLPGWVYNEMKSRSVLLGIKYMVR